MDSPTSDCEPFDRLAEEFALRVRRGERPPLTYLSVLVSAHGNDVLIVRVHGGLTRVIGPGLIVGAPVTIGQVDRPLSPAGEPPRPAVIAQTVPPQVG